MKKILIGLLGLFVIASYAKQLESPVRFAVIGDRTGDAQPGIYEEIIAEVERLKPDFVLSVGDAIQGYTEDSIELNKEWQEYKSIVSKLSMPIYFSPGNHDITTNLAQPFYERYIGKPYYSFDIKGLHFVALDVSRWDASKDIPKEQITWLIDDLKKNQKALQTFVFYHKPFWANEIAAGKSDTLHSLFRNFGVDAVFNGHTHQYFSGKIDNILYTCVSTSGGASDAGPTGILYHFTWVTVDKNSITIAPIKKSSVFPWDEVTISDIQAIDKIYASGVSFDKLVFVKDDFSVADSMLSVKITNLNSDISLQDTLSWTLAEGWSIKPQTLPVNIAPEDSIYYKFIIKNNKNLYPAPELSLEFPYAQDKKYELKKTLSLARMTSCYRADNPPIIDGKISEPIWQKPVNKLFSPDGDKVKIDSTYFYFAYNDKNLYIAAMCKDPEVNSIINKAVKQDDAVYSEDCVGYFFVPNQDTNVIYQIYFNPDGVVFDQKITNNGYNADREWNGIYEVKTYEGNNFWSIEARMPLEQLGANIIQGQHWGINFRRKQPRYKSAADWQIPILYDPKSYGLLIMN